MTLIDISVSSVFIAQSEQGTGTMLFDIFKSKEVRLQESRRRHLMKEREFANRQQLFSIASEIARQYNASGKNIVISAVGLHCLMYLAQSKHMQDNKFPLYRYRTEAWGTCPAVPELQKELRHRNMLESVSDSLVEETTLTPREQDFIRNFMSEYGSLSAYDIKRIVDIPEGAYRMCLSAFGRFALIDTKLMGLVFGNHQNARNIIKK